MEGLGHGAFRLGIDCIGFMPTIPTLLEDCPRDQPDTALPGRRYLRSAARAIPERESTGALVFLSWFTALCRWPPQDGQPACLVRMLPEAARLDAPKLAPLEGRPARRAPSESRFAFPARKAVLKQTCFRPKRCGPRREFFL